jgi:hypothetical protein
MAIADDLDIDVYVNTLSDPSSSSLATLPGAQLRVLCNLLERQARTAPLGRNATAWTQELDRLLILRDRAADDLGPGRLLAADSAARAHWARGLPIHTFVADQHQRLVAIEPDAGDVWGLDLRPVIGHPMVEWIESLRTTYGNLVQTDVVHHPDGSTAWTLTTSGTVGRHVIRAVRLPESDHERWFACMAPDAGVAPAGPTPVAAPVRRLRSTS